ncbi:hypothetical protein Tco_0725510 [Tanacetum coccineum]|uniref:Uncharacterized protein n=1 Tax=Tanacetum coccineum TaxID=301880 RepID=A0ABQ4YD32_9ASTR
MKPKVLVNLSTRTKPATESRKPMPKSHTRNHRILLSTSVNTRRAADHNRKLNVVDHNQFVIRSLKSVNTKPPQAKYSVNHTKKVWKATRNHNVNTTKTAWRPTGKVVGSVKPQWSKGRTVADSIAARLTRPTVYKFKTDCMILWNAEERDVVPPGCSIHTVIIDPHGIRGGDDDSEDGKVVKAVEMMCGGEVVTMAMTRLRWGDDVVNVAYCGDGSGGVGWSWRPTAVVAGNPPERRRKTREEDGGGEVRLGF